MNKKFLNIAKRLKPELIETNHVLSLQGIELKEGVPEVLDFGNHFTGYFSLSLSVGGSLLDAPVLLKVKFCECENELHENTDEYRGWIAKSWIQEEVIHIDSLPTTYRFPRRYAFRYVSLELLSSSSKCQIKLEKAALRAVTSAKKEVPLIGANELEKKIDQVALRTLRECMQHEFEDGPKRDQRLWLGDLRLQALTNYCTYGQNDLVKRCLYLFAGSANEEGRIAGCVFTKPKVAIDDTFMFDYSLFFISCLHDYYEHTKDLETLEDLIAIASRQLELASASFENDVMKDSDRLGWCFLDWNLRLNKQCGAHAIYLYAEAQLIHLFEILNKDTSLLQKDFEKKKLAAKKAFYDEEEKVFVSGQERQISYASNVWMILAGVTSNEEGKEILEGLKRKNAEGIVTPYMYHHYIEALIKVGEKEEARHVMNRYWGAMVENDADTFYELFNPENASESPYGGKAVLSYCHAWSCTPSYFYRTYFCKEDLL